MRGSIISIEGVNGVGKTFFEKRIRKDIGDNEKVVFVSEVSDRNGIGLDNKIIEILSSTGDRFFRMGTPLTETFLLLALKMYDYESKIYDALNEGKIVIEDRSIDTIAIYQSILLGKINSKDIMDTVNDIFSIAAKYRRPPDITFLLEDDLAKTIDRAQKRNKCLYSEEEIELINNVSLLYSKHAEQNPSRIIRFDLRTIDMDNALKEMKRIIFEKVSNL